jgi:hypothetical protein
VQTGSVLSFLSVLAAICLVGKCSLPTVRFAVFATRRLRPRQEDACLTLQALFCARILRLCLKLAQVGCLGTLLLTFWLTKVRVSWVLCLFSCTDSLVGCRDSTTLIHFGNAAASGLHVMLLCFGRDHPSSVRDSTSLPFCCTKTCWSMFYQGSR